MDALLKKVKQHESLKRQSCDQQSYSIQADGKSYEIIPNALVFNFLNSREKIKSKLLSEVYQSLDLMHVDMKRPLVDMLKHYGYFQALHQLGKVTHDVKEHKYISLATLAMEKYHECLEWLNVSYCTEHDGFGSSSPFL